MRILYDHQAFEMQRFGGEGACEKTFEVYRKAAGAA